MLNKRIEELPVFVDPILDTDIIAIVQGIGTNPQTRKVDIGSLKTSIGTIEEYTYEELVILCTTNALEVGKQYILKDHQTKYMQPYTNIIKTETSIESLILTAASINKFYQRVFSTVFINDELLYDLFDNVCEDGSTPRKGNIKYRREIELNNSAPWDFRTIHFVRTPMDSSLFTAWITATYYNPGTFRTVSGNIYRCRIAHTSDVFATDLASYKWENVSFLNGKGVWDAITPYLGGTVYANPTLTEYLTFNIAPGYDAKCRNCRIEYFNQGQGVLPQLGNIVIIGANNVQIGGGTTNVTVEIHNAGGIPRDITVGRLCSNIIISGNGITIEDGCKDNFIGGLSYYNTLGKNCMNNIISYSSFYNHIKAGSVGNYIHETCHRNVIGEGSSYNLFTGSSRDNIIGQNSSNNVFYTASFNTFLNVCSDNSLRYALKNKLGDNCQFIRNSQTIFDYGTFSGNEFGEGCNEISVIGGLLNSRFSAACNNIVQFQAGAVTNAEFGANCSNLNFGPGFFFNKIALCQGLTNKWFQCHLDQVTFVVDNGATESYFTSLSKVQIMGVGLDDNKLYYSTISAGGLTLTAVV